MKEMKNKKTQPGYKPGYVGAVCGGGADARPLPAERSPVRHLSMPLGWAKAVYPPARTSSPFLAPGPEGAECRYT